MRPVHRTRLLTLASVIVLTMVCATSSVTAGETLPRLRVSDNHRFLVTEDGRPFFWLGDTAWELFHRANRDEVDYYLRNRASNQFTVIQAVLLAEFDGLNTPNAEGERPLLDNDPLRPNEKYFAYADWVIDRAAELGLYVAVLPTWGDKWHAKRGVGPVVFTPQNAAGFGKWVGRRYRDRTNIVWVLGGDRSPDTDEHLALIRAMAAGLAEGDEGSHLMTYHPSGGQGSAKWFHHDAWLSFNLRQNGHVAEYTNRYDQTAADYALEPPKPVIDGEPLYEDHPLQFRAKEFGHSTAADVRRALYWDLFDGACGHTYGHHSVWQFWDETRKPINTPLLPWKPALEQPGAKQMQFGRRLIESRPFLTRVPDASLIVTAEVPTAVPGAGRYRFVATRDQDRTYAMIYVPVGRAFRVDLHAAIAGNTVQPWWFNPRDGSARALEPMANSPEAKEFVPPTPGEELDWVLVLDDASRHYPPPGSPADRPVKATPAAIGEKR